MSPPLTPPPVAITKPWAMILGGAGLGLVTEVMDFPLKETKKKGGRGRRMITFALTSALGAEKIELRVS